MISSSPDSPFLPPIYAGWIGELLQAPIPIETGATCSDCAMCATKDVERTEADHLFHNKTKCCTYFPKLPNFLAGKILLDRDPAFAAGRARFLSQFFVFTVVTPVGVLPPSAENARYGAFQMDFGQNPDLRCPHFIEEGGLCGIWKYRNGKCSTWFCKHVRGQTGLDFWRALKELLQMVEEKVSVWCIHELAVGDDDFRQLFPLRESDLETFQRQQTFYYAISKAASGALQQRVWGRWLGAERSFFERCARLIDVLSWNDIAEIGGTEMQRATSHLTKCFSLLTGTSIPQSLRVASFRSVRLNSEKIRVWGYSRYDPIDLPESIFDVLDAFDGSPTPSILERLRAERGVNITPEWLRTLCDFGILHDEGQISVV